VKRLVGFAGAVVAIVLACGVLLALSGCAKPSPIEDKAAANELTVDASSVDSLPATVVAVREQVQEAAPSLVAEAEPTDRAYTTCATALITRWEVSGQRAYERRWSGVYYPGGASGPTFGIGYDGGHQTRFDIAHDWAEHRDRDRLATTSGVIGASAKQRIGEWSGITVGYPHALGVFAAASLPSYTAGARRLYGAANWDSLEPEGKCGLVSNGYNRGFDAAGARRAEIRHRRDVCMPMRGRGRLECLAKDLAAEQRLWPDNRGLRDRRVDEAQTVLGRIVLPPDPAPSSPAPAWRRPGQGPAATFAWEVRA
jgi:hypothetical protein